MQVEVISCASVLKVYASHKQVKTAYNEAQSQIRRTLCSCLHENNEIIAIRSLGVNLEIIAAGQVFRRLLYKKLNNIIKN